MNQETAKVIKEYRTTVYVMSAVIIFCFVFLAFILLVYVPDTVYLLSKQAFNEVYDERIELTQ